MERTELGAALRTWRERLRPADAGLPAGVRRRTPGLRREEVAALAGVSVDYLTRLEQGRGPHPSDAVLTALARALRVNDAERDHLFHLAGGSPPRPGRIRSTVRPSVLRLMDRFTDLPAVLLDAKTDVLAWNPMGAALLGDLSAIPLARRNMARLGFTGDRRMGGDPAERERLDRALVSDLRRSAARYPDDPGLAALVRELRADSADFARLWDLRDLDERHSDHKTLRHPQLGPIELDCDTLLVHADDQVLLVYSAAPDTPAAQALDLLRVVGLQELRAHQLPSVAHVDGR
ncbi:MULTISPECIES: helix-turn-helix transcriptional regulator [unclassified Pseudonocardia]|uniref:helix-turn-helix transcriptional regulator n=1 Tax=unclassified Pseudonocardia TaxID=2619320 RepID=UPI000963D7A9|nr:MULTISPECIES: helix-turn-helix transcriptional regulator [unclassified Pseudonocardia]MBN9099795.1 helix-turn-helix domain-containing protein [Pseudonocardia sp.]OJY45319.1 MAG: transcriptional regulator [Pseudonocardia sp. 73-21]